MLWPRRVSQVGAGASPEASEPKSQAVDFESYIANAYNTAGLEA